MHPLIAVLATALATVAQTPAEPADVPPIAQPPRIHLRAGGWFTSMDGEVRAGEEVGGASTSIDLQDTLGLPSDKFSAIGSACFDLGEEQRWHLKVGYLGHFSYDGVSGPVSLSFNGLNFTGTVQSDATVDLVEITGLFDLTQAPVTLSVGVGSRIVKFDGSITGTAFDPSTNATSVRSESADAVVPLPGLAAALRWDISERLYVLGKADGMYVGKYGNYFDAAAEMGFDFTANVGIFAGYRWLHVEADVSDVAFTVNLRGPFAGVEVRF